MRKKVIILTENHCKGCDIVKERLGNKENIKILDVIRDEEGRKYFNKEKLIVPSAVIENKRCLLRIKDGKIHAECEDGSMYKLED